MDSKHIGPARIPRFLAIATLAFATAVLALLFSPVSAQEGDEVLQSVSEGDTDLPNDNATHGRVAVGGSATGNIGTPGDQDRFAVELQAGRTYRFDLTGSPGGGGTLRDTYFRAIYNSEGRYQSGSYNDDFDGGRDSRVTFTPTESGTYYARVSGDRDETGTYTLSVTGATPEPGEERPARPSGLSATATHDRVVLTWDDPGDDTITGYVILRRVRVNNTGGEFGVLVADTGTAATTYTDATVKAGTTYTYRIKAINEHGVSERSRWFHVDTPAAPERPAKPRGLSATASHDRVVLTWDDPGDDTITGYVILRRLRYDDPSGHFDELAPDTGSAATTYTDDTVAAETNYTYRIKAINEHGVSERSRWFHIDIPAAPERPAKPRGLSATASHDQVVLTWDDPGDDTITGYVILRRLRYDDPSGHFDELAPDTGSAATTYTDDTVAAETTYTYRIKAINEHGVSERSRWFHVDTPAAPPGPGGRANVSEGTDDLPANPNTTGEVDVGGSVTGNIGSFADRDYFRVVLEAGTRYQIDLEGVPTGRGTLADPALTLYDASEKNLLDDNTSGIGGNSRGIFTPTTAGTYYLRVADFDETDTGTYTLSVIVLGANGVSEADTDFPGTTATTGRVDVRGLGHGQQRLYRRHGLVRGRAGGGQDLPDRPEGRI